jgi:hypothetical protein
LKRKVVHDFAGEVGLDRFSSEPRDGSHLVPDVLTRERSGLEIEEAVHGGLVRPGAQARLEHGHTARLVVYQLAAGNSPTLKTR